MTSPGPQDAPPSSNEAPPRSSSSPEPSVTATSSVPVSAPTPERKTSIAFARLPDEPQQHRRLNSTPNIVSFPTARPRRSTSTDRPERPRSLSSPPPPSHFLKRVGFDTFDNKDAPDFSLTLKRKHRDYVYNRRSRTFLCGTDQNDYSEFALEWLIDELVDDGDEIVCLRVVDSSSKIATASEDEYRAEAQRLLEEIIEKNDDDKAISIVLEFAVGKVQETIQRMIHIYEPVILIVGTKGRNLGGLQGLLPGSVSKYCLQHSPVPVIVVRPSNKREKKKKKRQADPSRNSYATLLEKSSGADGLLGMMGGPRTPSGTHTPKEGDVSPKSGSLVTTPMTLTTDPPVTPIVQDAMEAFKAPTDREHAEKVEKV